MRSNLLADFKALRLELEKMPLIEATKKCHIERVRQLIEQGVNINDVDGEGRTALSHACDIQSNNGQMVINSADGDALKYTIILSGAP